MARIYVASSWRNQWQPEVVERLRTAGHEVYDFRNPPHGKGGFRWDLVDPEWQDWTTEQYCKGLQSPVSEEGFKTDRDAMEWADTCILVLPCGRSAHTEAGWFAGSGRKTIAYIPQQQEAELMYRLFDLVSGSLDEVIDFIRLQESDANQAISPDYTK